MSNKSARKITLPKATPVPRQMAEIEKEYTSLLPGIGQLQYEVFVKTNDLKNANDRLLNLNQEAAARKELDAKEVPAKEEATSV